MAGWSDRITLRDVTSAAYVDAYGIEHEGKPVDTEVFCNPWYTGLDSWATAAQLGPKIAARVEVKTIEFEERPYTQAVYRGLELDIDQTSRQGLESTILTLSEHARND